MATSTPKTLTESKLIESVLSPQYTPSAGVTAIMDKVTVCNISALEVAFSVQIVAVNDAGEDSKTIIKDRMLAPSQTYICPELQGHVLSEGHEIRAIATSPSGLTIRISGREIIA